MAANDNDHEYIYVKRFWHKAAKRYIIAPPGKAFRLRVRVKRRKGGKKTAA